MWPAPSVFVRGTTSRTLGMPSAKKRGSGPRRVLRHVRHDPHMSTFLHEISRVESLVSAHGYRVRSWNPLQHHRCIALRRPVGLKYFRVHVQSIAIFHQQVPAVTQLGLLAPALARQQGLGIGLGFVRSIRPLATKVQRGIARIVRRRQQLFFLRLKALRARPSLQQRTIHSKAFVAGQPFAPCLLDRLRACLLVPYKAVD
jgi:hypothetical protein